MPFQSESKLTHYGSYGTAEAVPLQSESKLTHYGSYGRAEAVPFQSESKLTHYGSWSAMAEGGWGSARVVLEEAKAKSL